MKIKAQFKTPDIEFLTDKRESIKNEIEEFLNRYIKYGECVTLEFDTVERKVSVLNVRK